MQTASKNALPPPSSLPITVESGVRSWRAAASMLEKAMGSSTRSSLRRLAGGIRSILSRSAMPRGYFENRPPDQNAMRSTPANSSLPSRPSLRSTPYSAEAL